MKKKMLGFFLVTLLLIATGITVAGTMDLKTDSHKGKEGYEDWGWYNPAGCFMRSDKYLYGHISFVSWGKYAITYTYIHDPTWSAFLGGLFSNVVGATDGWGTLEVCGKNTYDTTMIANGYDENYEIVYYSVYSGTFEMTSRTTSSASFTLEFYLPDQDPFGEDDPFICMGPFTKTYEFIPIVPPSC